MDVVGKQVLADPGFTVDEDGGQVSGVVEGDLGELADEMADLLELLTLADHAGVRTEQLASPPTDRDLIPEAGVLELAFDHQVQFLEIEGFFQVVGRSLLHRLDGGVDGGVGGDDENRDVGEFLPQALENLQPGDVGELNVEDGEVGGVLIQDFEGLPARFCQQALVARAAQLDLQRLQQWQFIVED